MDVKLTTVRAKCQQQKPGFLQLRREATCHSSLSHWPRHGNTNCRQSATPSFPWQEHWGPRKISRGLWLYWACRVILGQSISSASEMDVYDVIIIGAGKGLLRFGRPSGGVLTMTLGLYGIAAARCYLEIHPDSEVIIMESESVVGGTWSSGQLRYSFLISMILPIICCRTNVRRLLDSNAAGHGRVLRSSPETSSRREALSWLFPSKIYHAVPGRVPW